MWKSEFVRLAAPPTSTSVLIASELTIISDRLCFLWTSTRDNILRKSNFPCKHRYGLEFHLKHKKSHLVFLILLAGDIATNPGPTTQSGDLLDIQSTRVPQRLPTHSENSLRGLECLYLNSRSLKAFVQVDDNDPSKVCKITFFQQLVYSGDYDIVSVCETWLNDSVLDSELLKGYSIFRKDRVERNGGGVLVAVKDPISVKRRFDLEDNSIELVVVELSQINNQSIILYTYYRPPGSPLDDIQQLSSSLANIPESSCVLLVGDFNLPAIDWSSDHPSPSNVGGHLEDKFCELFADYFLEQLIPGPTHRGGNKLDLLLCNCPEIIRGVSTSSPEQSGFPTDHHILVFKIQKLISRAKSIRRTVFDYKRGNFEDLRKSLSNSPFDGTPPENIDEDWSRWKEWFLIHVDNFIPVKLVMDTNSPPWIDGEVRHFIRKKYAALKKFRQSKSAARKHKLRTLSQTIKYLVRRKYREYLAKVKNYFQDNPKLFWSYHKSILHHRVSSNAEISFKGVTAKTAAHKAELFNMYFSSVFTPSRPTTHFADANNSIPLRTDQTLSDVTINVNEISECLNGLDTSKACGPDGIPSRLLKECHQQIAPSLCDVFNHSLVSGRVPSEWKSANITPIHKKKQKEPAENYRPISLLPIISKVMER